jgi:hypothetical protein
MVASPGRAASQVKSPTRCPRPRGHVTQSMRRAKDTSQCQRPARPATLCPRLATTARALGRSSDETLTGQLASTVRRGCVGAGQKKFQARWKSRSRSELTLRANSAATAGDRPAFCIIEVVIVSSWISRRTG